MLLAAFEATSICLEVLGRRREDLISYVRLNVWLRTMLGIELLAFHFSWSSLETAGSNFEAL